MNDEKRFRDCLGNIGSVGCLVILRGEPYYGVTHYVCGVIHDGIFVKQAYRGRKVKFVSFSERDIHIVNV